MLTVSKPRNHVIETDSSSDEHVARLAATNPAINPDAASKSGEKQTIDFSVYLQSAEKIHRKLAERANPSGE